MSDFRTPPELEAERQQGREPGPQPDPMLEPGRRGPGWILLFAIAVTAIVAGTLYGLNNQEPQTAVNESAPATQSQSRETTGAAPQEQQPNDQGANAQKSGQSGGPANSPNAAAPQTQQGSQTNQQPPKQQ
jgi:hypothetical protein